MARVTIAIVDNVKGTIGPTPEIYTLTGIATYFVDTFTTIHTRVGPLTVVLYIDIARVTTPSRRALALILPR